MFPNFTSIQVFYVPHLHPHLPDCHDVLDFFLDQTRGETYETWWDMMRHAKWTNSRVC